MLGAPVTELTSTGSYPAQYFEKGRIEDHRADAPSPAWYFMYGRLTAELMERAPGQPVNTTQLTYGNLKAAMAHQGRTAVPRGFTGGTMAISGGRFVPYDAELRPMPGYIVPDYFWSYINRGDLFPGGWLHDIGLPMTAPQVAETTKNGERRDIVMQTFERTVLTYDHLNPREWQVERGNIGTDYVAAVGQTAPNPPSQNTPNATTDFVRQFLHHVTADPQATETGWADFLS